MLLFFGRVVLCLHVLKDRQVMKCCNALPAVLTYLCQLTWWTDVTLEGKDTKHINLTNRLRSVLVKFLIFKFFKISLIALVIDSI